MMITRSAALLCGQRRWGEKNPHGPQWTWDTRVGSAENRGYSPATIAAMTPAPAPTPNGAPNTSARDSATT